jgi:hypothetical protein
MILDIYGKTNHQESVTKRNFFSAGSKKHPSTICKKRYYFWVCKNCISLDISELWRERALQSVTI